MKGTQDGVGHLQPMSIYPAAAAGGTAWGRGLCGHHCISHLPTVTSQGVEGENRASFKRLAKLTLKAPLFAPMSYLHLGVNSTRWRW